MPRLLEVADLCSSTLSDTANMSRHGSTLCSPTVEKILCRSPIFAAVTCRQSAPDPQGKGEIHKRVETAGVYPLVPRRVGALPAEVQRKTSRPLGANTLTQFASPGQPVPKKPPARFAFPRLPYAEKTKKAPLTRCLSLLWICRPLSSSSCRNYRSRRRYYHHRYRRNRSRRCPDRSIPRSG